MKVRTMNRNETAGEYFEFVQHQFRLYVARLHRVLLESCESVEENDLVSGPAGQARALELALATCEVDVLSIIADPEHNNVLRIGQVEARRIISDLAASFDGNPGESLEEPSVLRHELPLN